METRAGRNGNEISWSLGSCKSRPGGYNDSSKTKELCCGLKTPENTINCIDNGYNGWEGGSIVIKGKRYCDDKYWALNPYQTSAHIDLNGSIYILCECIIPYNFLIDIINSCYV